MILDEQGEPISTSPACPKCASKAVKTINGFGGYWRRICEMCGYEVAAGREKPGEENA